MRFFKVDSSFLVKNDKDLSSFESHFKYPLGDDSFQISHGKDYLTFFTRIGTPAIYGTMESVITSIGAGVITNRWKAWYLCDMKVHPSFRGKKLTTKLFTRYFLFNYLKCQRGFALNMESSDGKKSSIVKILESLPWTPLKKGARLLFFYEDRENTLQAIKILSGIRDNIHFSSLEGKKDLILKSTGKAIPLLHMEWGEERVGELRFEVSDDQLHMWCLDENDPLVHELHSIGVIPKAKGLIFHRGMNFMNWSNLRTSEL